MVEGGCSIQENAWSVANDATEDRESIMQGIRDAVEGQNNGTGDVHALNVDIEGNGNMYDISTGAGALLLDNKLQELSVQEQTSAQILSANNRAVKEVNQLLR